MKLYRNAVILAVILGVIIGAYFYIKANYKPSSNQKNDVYQGMIKLTDYKIDDIDNITIINKGAKLVVAKVSDEDWGLIYPENVRADKYKSKSVALDFCPLYASKVIEENPSKLDIYGLDNPAVEVTVKMKDGSEKTILYGKKTATGENYYAKLKDSNTVYTISNYYAEKMIIGLYDIKDKTLFTEKSEDINGVTLWRNNEVVFSAIKGEANAVTEVTQQITGQASSWSLTAPVRGNADATQLQTVLDSIIKITVENYVEPNPSDLGKYGLDKPSYAIEIETSAGKKKILFGSEKTKDTETYAKMADQDEVFTVKTSYLNFVDKPLKDIMDVFACILNIDDVDRVEYTINGNTDVFELKSASDGDQQKHTLFFMNGKPANAKGSDGTELFREFYKNIIGIRMDSVDLGGKPTGQPDVTIVYHNEKDNSTIKVEFVSRDEYSYYVVKNGEYSGIVTSKKTFANDGDLVKSYEALKQSVYNQ